MAITRVYQPPVALIGEVARLAGQGQFEQKQDEFNARQAQFYSQLAQQDAQFGARMQQAAIDRNLRMQSAAAQQQARQGELQARAYQAQQDRAQRAAAAQQEQDFRRQTAAEDFQRELAMNQLDNQQRVELQDRQQQAQDAEAQRDREYSYGTGLVDTYQEQLDDLVESVRGRDLIPEGQQAAAKMMDEIKAVRQQASKMRPQQYAEALAAIVDRYGAEDWEAMTNQPDPRAEFEKNSFVDENGDTWVRDKDGNFKRNESTADKNPDPSLAGFATQKEFHEAAQDLIRNTRRSAPPGMPEPPPISLLDAYDELRRVERMKQIDIEMGAIQDTMRGGDQAAMLGGAAAGAAMGMGGMGGMAGAAGMAAPGADMRRQSELRIQDLEKEREKLLEASRALYIDGGKSFEDRKKEVKGGKDAPAEEPAAEQPAPNAPEKVREIRMPDDTTVDMGIPDKGSVEFAEVEGVQGKLPSLATAIEGFDPEQGFSNRAGLEGYGEPIALSRMPTKSEQKLLAGRWVKFLTEDGSVVRAKIPGTPLDLNELNAFLP